MKEKLKALVKTMRTQAGIEEALGENRCSFYLKDYADQLEKTIECESEDCVEKTEKSL